MEIGIDKDTLLKLLQQTTHGSVLLQREYMLGKDQWQETVQISGLTMGRVKLAISRQKIEKATTGNQP